jgi:hypothetical protein
MSKKKDDKYFLWDMNPGEFKEVEKACFYKQEVWKKNWVNNYVIARHQGVWLFDIHFENVTTEVTLALAWLIHELHAGKKLHELRREKV